MGTSKQPKICENWEKVWAENESKKLALIDKQNKWKAKHKSGN